MLPPTMPISLAPPSQSLPSVQSSTSSATTINGFHPNATYYPMQVFYYPTSPISPSIYLQTGQMHPAPMTFVLRGTFLY